MFTPIKLEERRDDLSLCIKSIFDHSNIIVTHVSWINEHYSSILNIVTLNHCMFVTFTNIDENGYYNMKVSVHRTNPLGKKYNDKSTKVSIHNTLYLVASKIEEMFNELEVSV